VVSTQGTAAIFAQQWLRPFPDVPPPGAAEGEPMDEHDRLSDLRDREHREEYAIRREERRMAREARRLQRELHAFDEDEGRAERSIEMEWRAEHYGRDPDRPPAWRGRA
jgi:hypothetical protein